MQASEHEIVTTFVQSAVRASMRECVRASKISRVEPCVRACNLERVQAFGFASVRAW